MDASETPTSISEYISAFPPSVQAVLERVRQVITAAVPDAQETISYRMPAFRLNEILLYFAAFKSHIGIYPPVSGDLRLERALSPYAGPKGNLKFPLDRPIPYHLITRIATLRAKQQVAKAPARRATPAAPSRATIRATGPAANAAAARTPQGGKA